MRGKTKAKKNVGGRPSKYRPEFCKRLIGHMGDGYSFESFGGIVSVSKQTLYDWGAAHPEFVDAKNIGEAASRIWWERAAHRGLRDPKNFNAVVWIFSMKNMHGWRDKHEHEHVGDAKRPIAVETLQSAFVKAATSPGAIQTIEGILNATNGDGKNGKASQARVN